MRLPCPSRVALLAVDVFGDLEVKGRDSNHLARRAQHTHARHTEILQDLRADSVRAQHARSLMPAASGLAGFECAYGLDQITLTFGLAQDHHDTASLLRDAMQRVAQRPAAIAADPD